MPARAAAYAASALPTKSRVFRGPPNGAPASDEGPSVGLAEAGIIDAIMHNQVLRRARRSARRQICGTGADHAVCRADPNSNKARIRQDADAHSDIDVLLKQAQRDISRDQFDL